MVRWLLAMLAAGSHHLNCSYWMAVYKLAHVWWDGAINEVVKAQCKRQDNVTQKHSATREKVKYMVST